MTWLRLKPWRVVTRSDVVGSMGVFRHLTKPDEAVTVLGMNAFRDTKLNLVRAFMDTDWGMRTVAFAGGSTPPYGPPPLGGTASVYSTKSFAVHLVGSRPNMQRTWLVVVPVRGGLAGTESTQTRRSYS
jgi:hypothetical protein